MKAFCDALIPEECTNPKAAIHMHVQPLEIQEGERVAISYRNSLSKKSGVSGVLDTTTNTTVRTEAERGFY
jgi:hypothetical protein